MIYIEADKLQEGLYQIQDGQIHKYKANGGTVRTYEMGEIVKCKDCKYAFLFDADDERDGLCGYPSNNAWDIYDEFYCVRGVKNE